MVVGVWSVSGRYGGRCMVGMLVCVWSVWWSVCGRYGGRCGGRRVVDIVGGV